MGRIFSAERFTSIEECEKVSGEEPPTLLVFATILRSERGNPAAHCVLAMGKFCVQNVVELMLVVDRDRQH
jgi:hypothetical protein